MNQVQPNLPSPALRDWREPVVIPYGELGKTIVDAASAGYEAVLMDVLTNRRGYRVTFQRMTASTGSSVPTRPAFPSHAELSQPPDL
jgi:hypothetical protein